MKYANSFFYSVIIKTILSFSFVNKKHENNIFEKLFVCYNGRVDSIQKNNNDKQSTTKKHTVKTKH
jgi:hypothetical protein